MTEPDLVHVSSAISGAEPILAAWDDVSLDSCSVVGHINSRGNFALDGLNIGNG
ncbi:hypothetical protein C8F04DRAFT_1059955 [Mycena alexandri]|uniref:Uncharacterized protein n=1 Tax=Mycena alexandri TaxID=1745969 RepID=A0AAD6TLY9_9AGAR|nr:hypothetical protein C8F04DRAFT_1059955 [Mycena alexandri]